MDQLFEQWNELFNQSQELFPKTSLNRKNPESFTYVKPENLVNLKNISELSEFFRTLVAHNIKILESLIYLKPDLANLSGIANVKNTEELLQK